MTTQEGSHTANSRCVKGDSPSHIKSAASDLMSIEPGQWQRGRPALTEGLIAEATDLASPAAGAMESLSWLAEFGSRIQAVLDAHPAPLLAEGFRRAMAAQPRPTPTEGELEAVARIIEITPAMIAAAQAAIPAGHGQAWMFAEAAIRAALDAAKPEQAVNAELVEALRKIHKMTDGSFTYWPADLHSIADKALAALNPLQAGKDLGRLGPAALRAAAEASGDTKGGAG